jgi:hypothetical protein
VNDIYAQKINSTGSTIWDDNGKIICNALGDQWYPKIVSDGKEGAIITWQDHRNGLNYDIYAQKIADPPPSSGTPNFNFLIIGLVAGISFVTGLVLGILITKRRK